MGGVAGSQIFQYLQDISTDPEAVGNIQAVFMVGMMTVVILYTLFSSRLESGHVKNKLACALLGGALGMLSAFLGIGGGPLNLAVLSLFFSMNTKDIVYWQCAGIFAYGIGPDGRGRFAGRYLGESVEQTVAGKTGAGPLFACLRRDFPLEPAQCGPFLRGRGRRRHGQETAEYQCDDQTGIRKLQHALPVLLLP